MHALIRANSSGSTFVKISSVRIAVPLKSPSPLQARRELLLSTYRCPSCSMPQASSASAALWDLDSIFGGMAALEVSCSKVLSGQEVTGMESASSLVTGSKVGSVRPLQWEGSDAERLNCYSVPAHRLRSYDLTLISASSCGMKETQRPEERESQVWGWVRALRNTVSGLKTCLSSRHNCTKDRRLLHNEDVYRCRFVCRTHACGAMTDDIYNPKLFDSST
ncbi:hypothetical protein KC327_g42 [Hortaea werneckii]|nr:hypothetical protein KC327_g42 [Hortaea werneckii]